MQTVVSRSAESSSPGFIGRSVGIKGAVISLEDLYVDGEVEGSIEAMKSTVTVGPNATLKASIKARKVIVIGSVHGPIEALESIDLRSTSRLVGDVMTAGIVIEDGAYFKGSINISRDRGEINAEPVLKQFAQAR